MAMHNFQVFIELGDDSVTTDELEEALLHTLQIIEFPDSSAIEPIAIDIGRGD